MCLPSPHTQLIEIPKWLNCLITATQISIRTAPNGRESKLLFFCIILK